MSEIIIDEDHNHAYGNDKALNYIIKADDKLVLNFEKYRFQVPDQAKGRQPDVLHVIQGKIAFMTNLPGNGRAALGRDNLEGNGKEPFTRFAGEFMVAIGFSMGDPNSLFVTWLSRTKATNYPCT